jgi:hypothetical protein
MLMLGFTRSDDGTSEFDSLEAKNIAWFQCLESVPSISNSSELSAYLQKDHTFGGIVGPVPAARLAQSGKATVRTCRFS